MVKSLSTIISLNDNNILIQQGSKLSSSRGFAWVKGEEIFFDFDQENTAVNFCRLQPQEILSRYWQQCAQTSIAVTNKNVRNSADLIWQHLSAIRNHLDVQDVVFVVPSHYQADNLQLLLGIANSTGMQPQALVNKAVLAAQHYAQGDGKYLHVDLQLHQTVCSSIEVLNGVAKLLDVDILNDVSIYAIQDALLKSMQQSFVQGDRFDPLHYAETEQQLFDQLAVTAQTIEKDGKAMVVVQHRTHSYSIAIDSSQWNAVVKPFADKIYALGDKDMSISFLIQLNKLFNGVVGTAFNNDRVINVEDEKNVKFNLSDDANEGDGLEYKIELPLLHNEPITKVAEAKPQQSVRLDADHVSHLMQQGKAVPLQNAILSLDNGMLSLAHGASSNFDSLLNKKHIFVLNDSNRLTLKLNDRIGSNHADGVITAIQVLE